MESSSLLKITRRNKRTAILAAGAFLLIGTINSAMRARAENSQALRQAATAMRLTKFNRDIAPIFRASCEKCHGAKNTQAKLRLDSEAAVLQGGISGKVIIPGNSRDSLLMKRLLGLTDAPRMPFGADPLSDSQIDMIRAWIDQGAHVDSTVAAHAQDARATAWPAPTSGEAVASSFFATKVRPIFAARCYQCHGPNLQQNGLRLDSLAAALKGSESGPVIIPGDSEKSRMVRRLLALERPQMPYGGPPLGAEDIKLIRDWIDSGAPGPDSTDPVAAGKPVMHWAYIKPVRPDPPKVQDSAWCRNPIDNFVLARLEREGLKPSPQADKETLIRRLSLDLTGLPPTPEDVDAFLADTRPDAYEKLVDRLLASP